MMPEDFHPGQGVVYRPYPGADPEQGIVVRATGSHVFVQYQADMADHPKATPPEKLEMIGGTLER